MPKIEIRAARNDELAQLSTIDHSCDTSHVWQMERLIEEKRVSINFREILLPRKVRLEYPRSLSYLTDGVPVDSAVLAAYYEELIVGYSRICLQRSISTLAIMDLVVDPEARRQGIGSALVVASQEWGMQRRLRRVIIEAQSKNYPAIELTRKLGYEFCGYNDHYYENQDIALFFARYLR